MWLHYLSVGVLKDTRYARAPFIAIFLRKASGLRCLTPTENYVRIAFTLGGSWRFRERVASRQKYPNVAHTQGHINI